MEDILNPEDDDRELGWGIAITAFDESGLSYGDKIPHSWFFTAFGLKEPEPQTSMKQAQAVELKKLGYFILFRRFLLQERLMGLRSIPNFGYQIITPAEQTQYAEQELQHGMRREIAKASDLLLNVNHEHLTDKQIEQNAEALNRLAGKRAFMAGNRPKRQITRETKF